MVNAVLVLKIGEKRASTLTRNWTTDTTWSIAYFWQGRHLAGSAVYFLNQNKATLII
jgi:hypothetical protein